MRPIPPLGSMRARRAAEPAMPSDANALGLWVAKDATDNGTTLTIPNRISGGAALTSTGSGRPTISTTGIEGRRPGISMSGVTQSFKAAVDLSSRNKVTIYVGVYGGGSTAGYLFAHGTATTRINAVLNHADVLGRIRAEMIGASGTTFHRANARSGGAKASPSVYAFVFDITNGGSSDVAQAVDNPRVDGDQCTIEDYGQVSQSGNYTNSDLYVCQSNASSSPFGGMLGCVYIRHGAHTIAERRTWTRYLQYFMGTYDLAEISFAAHSNILGSQGLTGGFRSRMYTSYLADTSRTFAMRYVGEFPVTPAFDQDYCYAASGWTMDDLAVYMPSRFGPEDSTLSLGGIRYYPDIIFLAGVSNDLFASSDYAAIKAKVASLIAGVKAVRPSTLFVISTELTRTDVPARIATWNSTHAPAVVSDALATGARAMLDTTFGDTTGVTLSDGIHPTEGGYDVLAAAMYPRLKVWVETWRDWA